MKDTPLEINNHFAYMNSVSFRVTNTMGILCHTIGEVDLKPILEKSIHSLNEKGVVAGLISKYEENGSISAMWCEPDSLMEYPANSIHDGLSASLLTPLLRDLEIHMLQIVFLDMGQLPQPIIDYGSQDTVVFIASDANPQVLQQLSPELLQVNLLVSLSADATTWLPRQIKRDMPLMIEMDAYAQCSSGWDAWIEWLCASCLS